MFDWLNTEILGIHLLHWLLSVLLPLLLAGLSAGYLIVSRGLQSDARRLIIPLVEKLDALSGRTINHLAAASEIFTQCPSAAVGQAFYRMKQESEELYQGRWLPDPAFHLRADTLFSAARINSLSLRPAANILAIGILGALASLLVQNQVPAASGQLGIGLILLPGLTGLAGAILVAASSRKASRNIELRSEERRVG